MTGERKYFAGAAAATTLAANIASTSDGVTITVTSDTGWPTGATYPHLMVVAPGTASEEKMLVKRTGANTFVVETGGRGYDGTTAATHATGDAVEHRLDADTITRLVSHAFGDVLGDHDGEYRKLATAIVSGDITSLAGTKVTGVVPSATKLATGRTITLTGAVTGTSGAFDGTGDVSLATTVLGVTHAGFDGTTASAVALTVPGDGYSLLFTNEAEDTDGFGNAGIVSIPTGMAGWYLVTLWASVSPNADTSTTDVSCLGNVQYHLVCGGGRHSTSNVIQGSALMKMDDGDTFTFTAVSSASGVSITSARFSIKRLGPQ